MNLADILGKLADGQTLSANEKQDMMLQVRRMQEAEALLTSLIQPGTKILNVDGLVTRDAKIEAATITDADIVNATIDQTTTGKGDVSMDDQGIWVTNQQAAFGFEDTVGNRFNLYLYSSGDDYLGLINDIAGKGIEMFCKMTDLTASRLTWVQDDVQANRMKFWLQEGTQGLRAVFGQGSDVELYVKGTVGGATFLRMSPTLVNPPTPTNTTSGVAPQIYIKGTKIVFQFEDAGTVRYKYLDLSGTGVTWVHTTVAP